MIDSNRREQRANNLKTRRGFPTLAPLFPGVPGSSHWQLWSTANPDLVAEMPTPLSGKKKLTYRGKFESQNLATGNLGPAQNCRIFDTMTMLSVGPFSNVPIVGQTTVEKVKWDDSWSRHTDQSKDDGGDATKIVSTESWFLKTKNACSIGLVLSNRGCTFFFIRK